jgi:hypothetical protein
MSCGLQCLRNLDVEHGFLVPGQPGVIRGLRMRHREPGVFQQVGTGAERHLLPSQQDKAVRDLPVFPRPVAFGLPLVDKAEALSGFRVDVVRMGHQARSKVQKSSASLCSR